MAKYTTSDIRNIVLVGHGGSGKTTLADAILHKTGMSNRFGRVEDGTSALDWAEDAKAARHSIDSGVIHASAHGAEFHIIDTPGYPDFQGAAFPALSAAETAVLVIDAAHPLPVNARTMWQAAGDRNLARLVLVNRMDGDNASFEKVYSELREVLGRRLIAINIPVGEGASFKGVVRVLDPKADAGERGADLEQARSELMDTIAETSEELMEKFLEEGELTEEEITVGLRTAIATGGVIPVLFSAAGQELGVDELLLFAARACPSPADGLLTRDTGDEKLEADPDKPLVAVAWRRSFDPFVSRINYVRVLQGTLKIEHIKVLHEGEVADDKFTGMFLLQGKEHTKIERGIPGDIVGLAKAEKVHFGNTITQGTVSVKPLPPIDCPSPMVSLAVHAIRREDEQKLKPALTRIAEDDPTFSVTVDSTTHEMVISGMSDLHLTTLLGRVKTREKVEVTTSIPKIAYLETIQQNSETNYRHKKQSGGAGEFAEVHLRIRPLERGGGFEFLDKIVGGVISKNYIPSVEKGVRSVMTGGGIIAGFPVVDVAVELFDGKEHPVDSKDVAFQKAGRMAFRRAMDAARPALLEPIYDIWIDVPVRYSGDVLSDISGQRRGRPMGMEQSADRQVIQAQVPLAQIQTYATDLRSMTGGDGTYRVEFSHYEVCPSHVQSEVAAKYGKKEAEEE